MRKLLEREPQFREIRYLVIGVYVVLKVYEGLSGVSLMNVVSNWPSDFYEQ